MIDGLSGAILDVDGTLVDSNGAQAAAWYDVLTEAGYEIGHDHLRRLIGMGSDKLLPAAVGVEKDSPEGKRLADRRKVVFHERYLPGLRPTRGARDLLERLRADGLRLIVASSAEGDELRALLEVCAATDLVADTTSSSEVSGSKPEPDIIEAALAKLDRPASEALMLGDTPYDIEAATRAGVAVVALRSGGWSSPELNGALAIYEDPADVLAHYDGSPFARRARTA